MRVATNPRFLRYCSSLGIRGFRLRAGFGFSTMCTRVAALNAETGASGGTDAALVVFALPGQ